MAYEAVACVWGFFSPPTKTNVHLVLEVAKALSERTPPGKKSLVCILPLSSGYKRGSVRYPCIRHADRWKLIEAFMSTLQDELVPELLTIGRDPKSIEIRLFDYEYKSKTHILAVESVKILASLLHLPKNYNNMYICYSQRSFEEIMQREWFGSDVLLREYKHILFPQGYTMADELLRKTLKEKLITYSDNQRYPPMEDEKEASQIVDSILFVAKGFQEGPASLQVRRVIQTKGYSKNILLQYLPEKVYKTLLKIKPAFSSPECEKRPTSSFSREPKRSANKRKTLKKKKTEV